MNQIKYRLYPTLLNYFDRFEKGYINETLLLDKINRVVIPASEAQQKGANFEEAVIKGVNEDTFDAEIVRKVRALLPRPMLKTQVYCEYPIENVLLYGYVDVIGKTLAVDIKTTRRYEPDSFAHSHQNFYLAALRAKGIRTLRYVITDFLEVYEESYDHPLDYSVQTKQIITFCNFVEDNRARITDTRIFGAS